jgi:hypothetical protein
MLNGAIVTMQNAASECRVIHQSPEGYRSAREYVLDASGALADLLEAEARELEKNGEPE